MLQKLFNGVLSLALFTGVSLTTHAQIQEVNSPYAQIGLGTISPTTFAVNRSLGHASIAYRSPFNINYNNPASYSAIKLTAFETAVAAKGLWLNDGTTQQATGTASLGYLAFAFPITKFWGSSIGLLPHNVLNYDLTSSTIDTELDTLQHRSTGKGTNYQIYWGNGFKYKRLSAGFNIGYLFGTTNKEFSTRFINVPNSFSNLERDELTLNGFLWNFGLQYEQKIKEELRLIVGVNGNQLNKIKANNDYFFYKAVVTDNGTQIIDTLQAKSQEDGRLQLPARLGAGVTLRNGNDWLLTAEVNYEKWEDFQLLEEPNAFFTNALQVAMGFDFVPDTKAITKFWQVANYRLGGFYNTGNIIIDDQKISQFGLTFGLGLPIRKTASRVNISMEIGQRGTTQNNLVRETFVNGTVGFTLNDRWFIKRKFD